MVRIDAEQKREFKAASFFVPLIALFLVVVTGGILRVDAGFVDYLPDGAFYVQFAVFVAIFALLIIALIVTAKKASKKIHDVANVYRTTEGIFDFDDPQSVVEALVLYQDYTSERLFRDLRNDNYCERIIFNMLSKKGLIKFENECLYVSKDAGNAYIKKLYLAPLENTCKALEIAKRVFEKANKGYKFEALAKDYVLTEELPEKEGMQGKVIAYHLDAMKEFFDKFEDLTTEIKVDYLSSEDKRAFDDAGVEMNHLLIDHEDEIILVERDVKQKYFVDKHGEVATHQASPIISMIFFLLLFGAILVGTHILFDMLNGTETLSLTAVGFEFAGAYILSLIATYVRLVAQEKSETLNEEGQAIVDKISGLKNFIENYTQLKNPASDNLYVIWNEFVFFARMFDVSRTVFEAAKDNGKTFDNEEILDYFKDTDCVEKAFALNKQACIDFASTMSHTVYRKYHYES